MKFTKHTYKTWFDPKTGELVHYKNSWTKKYKDSLILIGELQGNQNPYKIDECGIYRVLYGTKIYYLAASGFGGAK